MSSIREAGSLIVDFNSGARNGTETAAAIQPLPAAASVFVAASQVVGGALGVGIGCAVAADGFEQMKSAVRVKDIEGVAHGAIWTGVGVGYAGLSGVLGTNGIMTLKAIPPPQALTTAFGAGGIAFYSLLLGFGAYGLYQTHNFRSEMRSKSPEEAKKWLTTQANDPKGFSKLTLRVGVEFAEKLKTGDFELIDVEKACFKKMVTYILLVVIALLGIAASACVLVFSGPASPLLFAIGSLLWVGVDSSWLHNFIGEKLWALSLPLDHAGEKEEEHSTTQNSHDSRHWLMNDGVADGERAS